MNFFFTILLVTLPFLIFYSPAPVFAGNLPTTTTEKNKFIRTVRVYYARSKEKTDEEITKILARTHGEDFTKDEQDGVNLTNVYRYLCGLAPDVVLDPEYNTCAKAAANRCSKAKTIAHNLGSYTDKCNLHIVKTNILQVNGYMSDPGGPNRKERGHRTCILHPSLGKTGFGISDDGYAAMYVVDYSSKKKPPKKAVTYPGRGFFPRKYMSTTGWSYYPTEKVKNPEKISVEMFRLHEPPKATLPRKGPLKVGHDIVKIKEIFFSTKRRAQIVFEPDVPAKPEAGTIYFIRINTPGISDAYIVEFY